MVKFDISDSDSESDLEENLKMASKTRTPINQEEPELKDDSRMSFADPGILDKVDRLIAFDVGQHVALPQLVVVGDQSSGKSSVLEGLTKLPFPRDSGLCTRFATQITFRRRPEQSTSIYVNPAANASAQHKAKLRAWSKPNIKDLKPSRFLEIMKEVQELMGLGSQDESGVSGTFSEDVLRLEISGPTQQHLSIVDVPGIFRKTTEGVTTDDDRRMVQSMVRGYMENPRSLMLAVIPANVDIATQEILTMAEEVDKPGHRTLGVLTKPDLVDRGAERSVLDLLNGTKHKLHLGWQIVRNPGQADLAGSAKTRDMAEKEFFTKQIPWNEIKEENRGIGSLMLRLRDILTQHIRREFPKVQSEITHQLTNARRQLTDLGAKRGSSYEQRMYLMEISSQFQRVRSDAMSTHYVTDVFFKWPSLRLPTVVQNRNDQFAKQMETFGHLFEFDVTAESKTLDASNGGSKDLEQFFKELFLGEREKSIIDAEDSFMVRSPAKYTELYDCTIPDDVKVDSQPKPDILAWLDNQYTATRGFELSGVNSALLSTLFREQATKWDNLAKGYMSDVIQMVHSFITDLLINVAPDEHVRSGIAAKLMDPLLERYQNAYNHAEFLLKVEKETLPMTSNNAFDDLLRKLRQTRLDRARQAAAAAAPRGPDGEPVANAEIQLIAINESTTNKHGDIESLHDHLQAYYDVALKRFVDNVQKQAALHYLIMGEESPLELFSPHFVGRLTDEDLEEIAGEDPLLRRKRAALEKRVHDLEQGKSILR